MKYKSRHERVKMSKAEKRMVKAIATPITLASLIVTYFLWIIFIALFKAKRHLVRIAIFIFVCFSITPSFLAIAKAPYGHYTAPKVVASPTPYQYDVVGAIERIWGKDANIGKAIASCESGLRTNAVNFNDNATLDLGPFQVNSVHGFILDPEENIRYAYDLYLHQGLTPWASSRSCWKSKI